MRLQHANVVIPVGATETVAAFYEHVLGLRRIPKPSALDPRGAWFDVDGYAQVHLSERDGATHEDSHFALVVDDFDATLAALAQSGAPWTGQDDVFGGRRGFTRDPAGNRIELLERSGALR
ncbi:MAG TPA: VOC family protein [Frankiaceae bacterium]|nr:VOC family protein [Frankiaceae bacterium]